MIEEWSETDEKGLRQNYDDSSRKRAERELVKLKETISQKQTKLDETRPQYETMKKREEDCTRELSLKEQKRTDLYAKQGRASLFTSKAKRDEWIQKELKSLQEAIRDKRERIDRLHDEAQRDAAKKVMVEELIKELENHRDNIDVRTKATTTRRRRKITKRT